MKRAFISALTRLGLASFLLASLCIGALAQNTVITSSATLSGPGTYGVATPNITITLPNWTSWASLGDIRIIDLTGQTNPNITVQAFPGGGGTIDNQASASISIASGSLILAPFMGGNQWLSLSSVVATPPPPVPEGFLSLSTAQFVVSNLSPNSNDFTSGNGWTAAALGSASAPTVTNVTDTLPDGTTGTVSKAVFPAIATGTSAASTLSYTDPNLLGANPLSHSVFAKVVSGTGTLFDSISRSTVFADAPIPNDGQWHLVQATWVGSSLGVGANNVGLAIGINQNFTTERAAVGSITVELAGDYFVGLQSANVPSFADVKTGGPIATTGTPPLQAAIHEPFPAHVNIRDPSKWSLFSGNPITAGDPSEVWASGARGNPNIQPQFQSGGFFWAWNGECFSNILPFDGVIIAQCLYKSTDGLHWTEDANDPQLLLTGGIIANPVVSNAGSGFTAGTGTATYTGHTATCPVTLVISVTVTGTTIASATPSPNNGIGTGSCSVWPTGADTGWTFSGVGSGSGASFTFNEVPGTQASPGPVNFELRPQFFPFGCSDGTTPHPFCIVYSALDAENQGHLFIAWSNTVDGQYTPLGCVGPGSCSTVASVNFLNLPSSGFTNPGTPNVINVGGATGINYIYVYSGGGNGLQGARLSILTTPANSANTTSGNTLTYLHDAGITLVSGVDWENPTTGTDLIDTGIFLNHCGFYEMYFVFENQSLPNPPWVGTSTNNAQITGEAVSAPDANGAPTGPWYQLTTPVVVTNSGDPAVIELNGQFILTSTFNASFNPTIGAGFALVGPQGTCP